MKIYTLRKVIDSSDWDELVTKTYGRPYSFQQQEGCRDRGVFCISVPGKSEDASMSDSVPEVADSSVKGVRFAQWLSRDPKQPLQDQEYDFELDIWWARNFYPDVHTLANDLHARGLLEAGDYDIVVDW